MKEIARLSVVFIFYSSLLVPASQRFQACLPDGINPTDIASIQTVRSASGGSRVKKITVRQKLAALKARCKAGKLVDAEGKAIYFFRLQGCWGNPPADYQEILQQQQQQLEKLKQRYTVVEMTCNPEGTAIQ